MDLQEFVTNIIKHEGLEPRQTPFRIVDPSQRKWVSMYDDTIRLPLDPNAVKSKGRENFLYVPDVPNAGDLVQQGVQEQFRRYQERQPDISIADAIRIFDQTGAEGKLKYLQSKGIDVNIPLRTLYEMQAVGDEIRRQTQ